MLREEYDKINTPEELLEFMSNNINYGYLGKNNKIYNTKDENFNNDWYEQYILQTTDEILKTKYGNCWDQTELEREWFIKNNYEIKTIFVMVQLNYKNNYPTHSFLIYKDNDTWNWFENSDNKNRGIHKFKNINDLLNYQLKTYIDNLKTFNITEEELTKIIIKEFNKPKENSNTKEYLDFVINSSN